MHIPEEINIQNMIVHILDKQLGVPVLSMDEIPSSMEIKEYLAAHLVKVINDDALKTTTLHDWTSPIPKSLLDYKEERLSFVEFSQSLGNQLFELMTQYSAIDACDLVITTFNLLTEPHVALLKMNYQNTYIHFTDYESAQNVNTIMQHRTTLPNPGQKVSEAIIVRLADLQVRVLEKKHDLDGQLDYYLSNKFLQGEAKLSSKEQMKIVKTATEQVTKKFYDHDPEKQAQIKQNLYQAVTEEGVIDLETFAQESFEAQPEIREIFKEKLEKKGLVEPIIQLEEKTISQNFQKQRLKTDNGIEIKMPMSLYNDPETMEFVTGVDGKISIILKNIGKIL